MKGLIIGKFYPFHNGHKAMMDFALTKCETLTIIICAEESELISGETRYDWIRETYHDSKNVEIIVFNYKDTDYPNTSESDRNVSKIWANIIIENCPKCDCIITSEDYGDYIAEYTGMIHLLYDKYRSITPISGTLIRQDLYMNWDFLPDSVKKYYQIRIVISGTESTGKSILAEFLASQFEGSEIIREAGRDLIDNSNDFSENELYNVLTEHYRRILESKKWLLFIDTDYVITSSYCKYNFNNVLKIPDYIVELKIDSRFYLDNTNVPFIQDGTRLSENERNNLDLYHRKEYENRNLEIEIKSLREKETLVERNERILLDIRRIIKNKFKKSLHM